MKVFELLRREIDEPMHFLLLMLFLGGVSNATLMGSINSVASSISNQEFNTQMVFSYMGAIGFYLFTKQYVSIRSAVVVEKIVVKLRYRIANKIRLTELETLERVGIPALYTCITSDIQKISNVSLAWMRTIQNLLTIFFVILYIAIISPWTCLFLSIGFCLGSIFYAKDLEKYRLGHRKIWLKEKEFFEKFSHIIDGFKEIRINRKKSNAIATKYAKVNQERSDLRIKLNILFYNNSTFSQIFFFITIAIVFFVVPTFHKQHSEIILSIVPAILYIISPIENCLNAIVNLSKSNYSAQKILELEYKLDKELEKEEKSGLLPSYQPYNEIRILRKSITLESLTYSYPSIKPEEPPFSIGPIDLTVNRGEIVFLTGKNGCGKSTLFKVLTGLYLPKSGNIYLDRNLLGGEDGMHITSQNYEQYRNLFTTIFADFHLFDELYGVENVQENAVNHTLEYMGLYKEKVQFKDNLFSTIKLSSGQKKRLALTIAMWEDKAVYLFDEVAADLDPSFRETYYYEILPYLKSLNKVVIVVSHDKNFWDAADKVFEIKNGLLVDITSSIIKNK